MSWESVAETRVRVDADTARRARQREVDVVSGVDVGGHDGIAPELAHERGLRWEGGYDRRVVHAVDGQRDRGGG